MEEVLQIPSQEDLRQLIFSLCTHMPNVGGLFIDYATIMDLDWGDFMAALEYQRDHYRRIEEVHARATARAQARARRR